MSEPIAFGSVDAERADPFEFENQFFGGAIDHLPVVWDVPKP